MKISGLFAAALAAVNLLAAEPVATSVTARQRYPWNGKVDIVVTFSGASNDVAKAGCVFAATNSATKAALAMAHVTDAGTIFGSGTTWTRRYVWDAAADLGEVKIADVVLAAEAATPLGGVQLWEGGPYWAECNVGATKPEEKGEWGLSPLDLLNSAPMRPVDLLRNQISLRTEVHVVRAFCPRM